jgi:hypothetical protein
VLAAVTSTLALWAILALVAFGSRWWRRPDAAAGGPAAWLRPVFGRYLALIAIALRLMVFVANVTVFKDRWLLPLLAPVPLMAFALRPELDTDVRGKRFTVVTLALILVVAVAAGAQPWFAYVDSQAHPFNAPAVRLAQALRGAGYDGQGRIIAADALLAGTLLTRFPAARADVCYRKIDSPANYVAGCVAAGARTADRAGRGWLIISSADRVKPGWWDQALARIPGGDNLPRGSLRIPLRRARRDQPPARYDFIWRPAPALQP